MANFTDVLNNENDSQIGGVKYKILYIDASKVDECPQLPAVKTTDDHYHVATGSFTLNPNTETFKTIEVINRSGEMKWESVGNPGSLKSKLMVDFDYSGINAAIARFTAEAKNANLIMVIERADCSGQRYLFGGCCLPAQMTKYTGTLGKKPEDDVKTTFTLEAYATGMPVVLDTGIVIPL